MPPTRNSERITDAPRHLATIAAAADRYGVAIKTIQRRVADGTITAYRLGPRMVRVDLDECDRALLTVIPTAGAYVSPRGGAAR